MALIFGGTACKISPRGFKKMIGDLCPQFQGYNQHDAHELLNFLLDGLHEDLNRIFNKPFTDMVEAKGRPDDVVAREFFDTYKLRNDRSARSPCTSTMHKPSLTLLSPLPLVFSCLFGSLSLPLPCGPSPSLLVLHLRVWHVFVPPFFFGWLVGWESLHSLVVCWWTTAVGNSSPRWSVRPVGT